MNAIFKMALSAVIISATACQSHAVGRKTLFNDGWNFLLADSARFANAASPADDWRPVCLPHDWSISQPFDRNAAPGNDGGYLPGGYGIYRKTLNVAKKAEDKIYKLYFEGVYERSQVIVNGRNAGGHPYGYSSFFVDITPYIIKGDNEIVVKVDNSRQKNCRWYSGSGIYRNVWLIETADVKVADWGVGIQTPDLNTARIEVEVDNVSAGTRALQVTAEVEGAAKTEAITLSPQASGKVNMTLRVPDAAPWSVDSPRLYTAKITVREKGKVLDEVEQTFGFRTISYSADDGFRLNGKRMVLNGGCVHHDNGIIGAAAYDRAEYRKAEMLKDAGFNAVRTSHNPPSEAFLDACDRLGLLVIDEAFDGWRDSKNRHDYHLLFNKWAEDDVARMVKRDVNHPSIFCWSIGNEIIERKKPQAVKDAAMLAKVCHDIDSTRPVTQALAAWDRDWEIYDPLAAEHDIVGYNYMIHKAEGDHGRVPERVMMQTESYPRDAWDNYVMTRDHSYVIGDFVWTAIDYLGESGIGRWYYDGDVPGEHYSRPLYPWHAAYCGDIDLTGLRKPIGHYRSMLWNDNGERLFIAVREPEGYRGNIKTTLWGTHPTFECWSWAGHEGKPITVEVCSRYPLVRLYLNGKLVGEAPAEKMMASFSLPYMPGVLRAEGVENGAVRETVELKTAGKVADIRLTADRSVISTDGQDLSFVTIECVDADGNLVPVADNRLSVTTTGNVALIGLGNADIKDTDPYYDNTHRVWHGRALAVVRNNGKSGKAAVSVTADINGKSLTRSIGIKCR